MPRIQIKPTGKPEEKAKPEEHVEEEENNEEPAAVDDLTKRDTVLVCLRVRGLNRKEQTSNQTFAWKIDNQTLTQDKVAPGKKPERFTYDQVWGPGTTNGDIFNQIGFSVIRATMEGYHGVVFAYGQTSSGKTYTIHGGEDDPGLIPRSVEAMFEYIENTPDRDYVIRVAYMEIYNEVVNDLIDPTKTNLKIREDPKFGVHVDGLTESAVMSSEHVYSLLAAGESHRHVGRTDYNAVSSRSHTVFQVMVQSQSSDPTQKTVLDSKLSLVDLAGSENTSKVGADNQSRVKETGHINKSLLALSSVIFKISEGKSGAHIPYRDSKLTRILQQSLNGSACISVICAISPSSGNVEESLSTLKFATRAKEIKNTATVNEKDADGATLIAKYKEELEALRQQLAAAQQGGGGVGVAVAANQVSLTALEEARDKAEQERAELQNEFENMAKRLLHSSVPSTHQDGGTRTRGRVGSMGAVDDLMGGVSHPATAQGNVRRPSYLTMFGASQRTYSVAPVHGVASMAGAGRGLDRKRTGTTAGIASLQQKAGLQRLRAGSLGLTEETGNAKQDELLCLPQHVSLHFEQQALKDKASQADEKLIEIREEIDELQGVLVEKQEEANTLRDEIQAMEDDLVEKNTAIQALTEHARELEAAVEEEEAEEAAAAAAAEEEARKKAATSAAPKQPVKAAEPVVQAPAPPATIQLALSCQNLNKKKKSVNPLMGFFMKNESTGLFEYEGRTEWVKNNPHPIFQRKFTVRNLPKSEMRFSVYDVDNEQSIQAGDFIGSATVTLADVIAQATKNGTDTAVVELETDDGLKSTLTVGMSGWKPVATPVASPVKPAQATSSPAPNNRTVDPKHTSTSSQDHEGSKKGSRKKKNKKNKIKRQNEAIEDKNAKLEKEIADLKKKLGLK